MISASLLSFNSLGSTVSRLSMFSYNFRALKRSSTILILETSLGELKAQLVEYIGILSLFELDKSPIILQVSSKTILASFGLFSSITIIYCPLANLNISSFLENCFMLFKKIPSACKIRLFSIVFVINPIL